MASNIIAQGAEATILKQGNSILKQRLTKAYRHPQLDSSLRKFRTRREAKILLRLAEAGFPVPKLITSNDKTMEIHMARLEGPLAVEVLDSDPQAWGIEIGILLAELHNLGITHGDVTTSNMVKCSKTGKIHLIDFGLSQFSERDEERAVDLHILFQALEAKHSVVWEPCRDAILESYQKIAKSAPGTLKRLKLVESRGRNKHK
jgi:TP53 regulating kinase and related kinases